MRRLNIFVPHCSDLLTDHQPHGDGLVANGFIRHIAERGHNLYVAAERVDVLQPFPANVHITPLNPKAKAGFGARVAYMRQMRHLYRELSRSITFDIIHQLNPVFTGMSLALAGERPPVVLGPYVASWPDDPDAATASAGKFKTSIRSARTRLAALQQGKAAVLLLTTPAAQDRVPHYQAMASRVRMLPHGLDTNYFLPPDQNSVSEDVLFLSNLVKRKGIFDLLQAFQTVAVDFPFAKLLIAGDGPERPKAESMAAAMACSDRVLFLGRQSRWQSLLLLQRCAVFCQPSLGEPFGMSAAEAMSCGKPLIVTNAGGLKYILDERGGFHVPIGSPGELANSLRALLADAKLRSAMGEHNRKRIIDWMSWERVVERLEAIYSELIPADAP